MNKKEESTTVCIDGHEFRVTFRTVASAGGNCYTYLRTKVNVGRHPLTGRPRQVDVAGRSLEEIKTRLKSLLHCSIEDAGLIRTDVKLNEWYEYASEFRKNALEKGSMSSDRGNFKNHILPYLGECRIVDITEEMLINWQEDLISGGCSINRTNRAITTLSTYLDMAVNHRYLAFNPCRYCKIGRIKADKRKMVDDRFLQMLLSAGDDNPYPIFFAVVLLCALRYSEALAICWDDIDWIRKTLTIHQQISYDDDGKNPSIKPYTKGRRPRTICLPETALRYFDKQKNIQKGLERDISDFSNVHKLVFTAPDGGIMDAEYPRLWLRSVAYATGADVRIHDLRRTCVSRAMILTGDLTSAMHYLGHMYAENTFVYLDAGNDASVRVAETVGKEMEKLYEKAGLTGIYGSHDADEVSEVLH